ncbi:MAG: hypothetical protein A3J38_06255 [Gammaproteobacteria bacterium RIFCSPHIGHO2_12_FULL_45_9]|nr:MAG: hypothetical protein A3J38_06255 [Gammaproteobacteria bacterium RIFCSPHIGHO2_12_FULL_45_9]
MSSTTLENVSIQILGRSYSVRCAPPDIPLLHQAATLVETQMQRAQPNSQFDFERVAILTALNLSRDLLQTRTKLLDPDWILRLEQLKQKIATTLIEDEKPH